MFKNIFFPRNLESLLYIPENLITGDVKDQLKGKIRAEVGKGWDEHTKSLPDLQKGDTVLIQNLRGRHALKSDHKE